MQQEFREFKKRYFQELEIDNAELAWQKFQGKFDLMEGDSTQDKRAWPIYILCCSIFIGALGLLFVFLFAPLEESFNQSRYNHVANMLKLDSDAPVQEIASIKYSDSNQLHHIESNNYSAELSQSGFESEALERKIEEKEHFPLLESIPIGANNIFNTSQWQDSNSSNRMDKKVPNYKVEAKNKSISINALPIKYLFFERPEIKSKKIQLINKSYVVDPANETFVVAQAGVANLVHRSTHQSFEQSFKLSLMHKTKSGIFINTGFGISKWNIKSRVNSLDLRIDGLQLSQVKGAISDIHNSISLGEVNISLGYLIPLHKRLSGFVALGASQRWSFKKRTKYLMVDEFNNDASIDLSQGDNYKYPLYSGFSFGINYFMNSKMELSLAPFYSRVIQKSDLIHPKLLGMNLGIKIRT